MLRMVKINKNGSLESRLGWAICYIWLDNQHNLANQNFNSSVVWRRCFLVVLGDSTHVEGVTIDQACMESEEPR